VKKKKTKTQGTATYTVQSHFEDRDPSVKKTYAAIVKAARKLGPIGEEPKKTSIHLVRSTAFAGVATRKAALILTLKSDLDVKSDRIVKRQRTSASRWHLELKLTSPGDVDRELLGWMAKAYELSA
jgi:hypothetical protein